ncbi:MAG: hypothetical protein ACI8X3_000410 [Saprospiraceae bacterium]|jgi:hypothetical protein
MNIRKYISIICFSIISIISLFFYQSCVDPVEPEYDFQNDIILVDAYALTEPGLSTVSIKKSVFEYNRYYSATVSNAKVKLENVASGLSVDFLEDSSGIYLCPDNFAVTAGEVWKLYIELEDGRHIESKAETATAAIPFENIDIEYSSEARYDIGFDRFIPGHTIQIDWNDPPGEKNYYLWKYRTFEPLYVCKTCERGIFRDGKCQRSTSNFFRPYTSYLCDPSCWMIRNGEELPIFEDRFSDGAEIIDREIAIIPFFRRPDVLVEIQQYSLNESAYDYFRIINNLISENSGLNAPPPAALLGNLYSPDDLSEVFFGNFTVAGVSTKNIFIDRSNIFDNPLTRDPEIVLEPCPSCPTLYPCTEGALRTAIKPEGWP